MRPGRSGPQRTQADAGEEFADRGLLDGCGGVALLGEDLGLLGLHGSDGAVRGPSPDSVSKDIIGYFSAMHRVVALVRPVQSPFELGCAVEVFGMVPPGTPRHYEFEVCTETPGQVPTSAGYAMLVKQGLSALASADTVLIPGWTPVEAPLSTRVRRALLRARPAGRGSSRSAQGCSRWRGPGCWTAARPPHMGERRPTERTLRVRVEPDRLYMDHGDVATSAGAGAGIDLCLHLVRKDHGAAHAALVARHMVMPPHRDGGQVQYAPPAPPADALEGLLEWAGARLGTPLSVDELAAHLNVSPRTLARRFADQLGTNPGAWLLARRVAEAHAPCWRAPTYRWTRSRPASV